MDINPTTPSLTTASLPAKTIQSLNLTLNQQLDVKVVNSGIETQTMLLKVAQSNTSIQVQSPVPLTVKQGQTFQLELVQLTPSAEFKVIRSQPELIKPSSMKNLVFKQVMPTNNQGTLKSNLVAAEIISVQGDKVQVKLADIRPDPKTSSVITLSRQQLPSSDIKPGQKIQLEINQQILKTVVNAPENNAAKLANGQQFSAHVVEVSKNKVKLQLSDTQISLNKNDFTHLIKPLKPGQEIYLEVVKTAHKTEFMLKTELTTADHFEKKITDTIKQAFSIQASPTELVNQLVKTLPIIDNSETISANLKRLAKEIVENLPQIKQITQAKQLKTTLANSGLFLEKNLTQATEKEGLNLSFDLKNQLLKFQQAIHQELEIKQGQKTNANELNLLKELQQKTDNSLAKIMLNQLSSLPKEEGAKQLWIIDFPYFNKGNSESIKLEIDHDRQGNEQEQQNNWSVTITVTPPESGTIYCKISCLEKKVHTRFWSNEKTMVGRINKQLDYLKNQFEKAGINPGHLSAHTGTPVREINQKIDANLFDQKV